MTSFSSSRFLGFRRASVALFLASTVAACESDQATAAVGPADDVFAPSNSVITNPSIGGRTNVGVGDTLKLDAANATRRGRNFHWTSSNASIARVNLQGLVVATGVGSAVVFAISSSRTDQWNIDVGKAVSTIFVTPESVVVAPGNSAQLAVVLGASDGTTVTGRRVTFRSFNTSAATVSDNGLVQTIVVGNTSVVIAAGNINRSVMVRADAATAPPTTPPTTPANNATNNAAHNAPNYTGHRRAWSQRQPRRAFALSREQRVEHGHR